MINDAGYLTPKHFGLKLLMDCKGSQHPLVGFRWVILRNRNWYWIAWRLGGLLQRLLLLLVSLRRTSLISIPSTYRAVIIDCHRLIERDLYLSGICSQNRPVTFIKLKYRVFNVAEKSASLLRAIQKAHPAQSVEDFSLAFEYAWHYEALLELFEVEPIQAILLAKDISPISAACLALAMERGLLTGLYSVRGMEKEEACIRNRNLFDRIFVASKDEAMAYENVGRKVGRAVGNYRSAGEWHNPKQVETIGLMAGSIYRWSPEWAVQNMGECLNELRAQFPSAKLTVRLHPGSRKRLLGNFQRTLSRVAELSSGSLDDFLEKSDFIVSGASTAILRAFEKRRFVVFDRRLDENFPRSWIACTDGTVYDSFGEALSLKRVQEHYASEFARHRIEELFKVGDARDVEVLSKHLKGDSGKGVLGEELI